MLLAAAGVTACSNSNAPPPDTFVNAAVGGGASCSNFQSPQEWLQIGTATGGHPTTVQDGGQDRNATVNVTCTVHPQGSGFDIELSAIENGTSGGSLTITSPSGKGIVTATTSGGDGGSMGGVTGITATFIGKGGIRYSEQAGGSDPTGCTLTYEYDPEGSVGGIAGDSPVPVSPPVAAGRIWGHIFCPKTVATGQEGVICNAEADFIFEQCGQ